MILVDQIKVLLVENSESDALEIGEILASSNNYECEIYHTGSLKEAEQLIHQNEIDITLVNLFLPDSYGIHTFDNLFQERQQSIPEMLTTVFRQLWR